MWATSVIFIKKLTKISIHPVGENSPNLVTLARVHPTPSAAVRLGGQ
jgi:hypothetical protein